MELRMLPGDDEWRRLAGVLHDDDAAWLALHEAHGRPAGLDASEGPIPSLGAVATAPVILLAAHPRLDAATAPSSYRFRRDGWPLAALHPDAPAGLADRFQRRLASLIRRYGALHVAHSVAVVYLTPWPSAGLAADVDLPSRRRTLELATRAAERDAVLVVCDQVDAWLAHPPIAALPATRRWIAEPSLDDDLDVAALGPEGWDMVCKRIAVHAWL